MKICILSIVNIKHMSAASLYMDYFRDNGIKYDIIYIDKYSHQEKVYAEKIYRFDIKINPNWSKIKKMIKYFTFRKYAKNILTKNKYDLVITWGTETALLFADYLMMKLKNRYIVNIRDYANINNNIKYLLLKEIISKSKFTTISSNGFKVFLPKKEYILVHSLNRSILDNANVHTGLKEKNDKIKICFLGNVRFYYNDKKLMDALGNDNRFILQYFGIGSEVLKHYANRNNISNVEFVNSFDLEQTAELLDRADIINNLYGYNDIALDTAVSIKYYYAVYLRLPIMVFKGTYMEQMAYDISFVFDGNYDNLGNKIYEWYHSIDFEKFKLNCNKKMQSIDDENMKFYYELSKCVK